MQAEMSMSTAKSRTIPPLRVSEQLRADAESVLAPGETLSAFVMDAVSRTIDFRKSQLDFLARGRASAERARTEGDYVPANKAIAGLRKRLTNARRAARKTIDAWQLTATPVSKGRDATWVTAASVPGSTRPRGAGWRY
jgi:hypothetical protein